MHYCLFGITFVLYHIYQSKPFRFGNIEYSLMPSNLCYLFSSDFNEINVNGFYSCRSNCDFSAANTLRKHYKRPYFLPELSESSKTDWIFMGSPGYGAHLHVSC